MSQTLFDAFPPQNREAWLELLRKDLKGKDLTSLLWKTEDGLELFPAVTAADVSDLPHMQGQFPGDAPYARGAHALRGNWHIACEAGEAAGDVPAADYLRSLLEQVPGGGIDALVLHLAVHDTATGMQVRSPEALLELLRAVPDGVERIELRTGGHALTAYTAFLHACRAQGHDLHLLRGSLDHDPMTRILSLGDSAGGTHKLWEQAAALMRHGAAHLPGFRCLQVNACTLHEGGASLVQETAWALNIAVDYADRLTALGMEATEVFRSLQFRLPVGVAFFPEIARFRAFRMLWGRVLSAYGIQGDIAPYTEIHASGSRYQLSALDVHTNLLRQTTEAMAAALGGCDLISLPAFTAARGEENGFSLRMARNLQLMLRDESFLGQADDAAGGAWYIEAATAQVAEKAWALFQQTEQQGGFLAAWEKGWIGEQIAAVRNRRAERLAQRREVRIGVNQYPNPDEAPPRQSAPPTEIPLVNGTLPEALRSVDAAQWPAALLASLLPGTDLYALASGLRGSGNPLPKLHPGRLPAPFEELRSRVAAAGQPPRASLFTFGDPALRSARAGFARNLLGAGGCTLTENAPGQPPEAVLAALAADPPDIVVLCAADTDYFAQGMAHAAALKALTPTPVVLIAGKPEGADSLIAAGADACIFAGMDALKFLHEILNPWLAHTGGGEA